MITYECIHKIGVDKAENDPHKDPGRWTIQKSPSVIDQFEGSIGSCISKADVPMISTAWRGSRWNRRCNAKTILLECCQVAMYLGVNILLPTNARPPPPAAALENRQNLAKFCSKCWQNLDRFRFNLYRQRFLQVNTNIKY